MNVPKQDDQPTPTDREAATENTDRELWREREDYYAPSVHVTRQGAIAINVGGLAFVKTLAAWHALARVDAKLAQPEEPREHFTAMTMCECGHEFQMHAHRNLDNTAGRCYFPNDGSISGCNCPYFQRARTEQPASEGGGASRACPICKIHGIIVHGDREVCAASWCNYFKMYPHCFVGNKELCGKLGCGKLASHDIHAAPTPPATGEAADSSWLTRKEMWDAHDSASHVGDVEQAELPPLVNMPNLIRAYGRFTPESSQAYDDEKIKQRERQLRAERTAHKATRGQLTLLQERLRGGWREFELDIQRDLQAEIDKVEAENQELRRKLEGRDIMEFDLDQEGSQL